MLSSFPKKVALAAALGVTGVCVGCPPASSSARSRVEGRVEGAARRVVLFAGDGRVRHECAPGNDGAFAFEVAPLELAGSRVAIESGTGATTTTGPFADTAGVATRVTVAPLALWPTRIEVKREPERVRFGWAAFPRPADRLRYSLVFAYASLKDGQQSRAEASIVTREPEAVQTLEELASLFPDRDPAAKTLDVQARAYDAGDPNGTLWAGEPLSWPLPDDFPAAEKR
jgi:hypothetical protein